MRTRQTVLSALAGLTLALTGCSESGPDTASTAADSDSNGGNAAAEDSTKVGTPAVDVTAMLESSLEPRNGVGMDRLKQSEMQVTCSEVGGASPGGEQAEAIRAAAKAGVTYPEDGNYLGDWKAGETIAQTGTGMQYSDDPDEPNGGNCYACHQLDPEEVAYGTLGPSLTNYGQRGTSEQMLTYTWDKLWNPHAFNACSHMPRFGDAGILTEQQLKDVMAYLLDPDSPVNRKP
ncbi:sulfur oxidation c-type cytochrome SoxX [Spectribacter hydrogenoxidans]|uniref:Sulfur oxidation c-type cytochrome SoxX n=1 Tax=Spectribacter hydrogenoxidans TaxID=3075608 RepID=A0ABU3BXS1_9GAMM|nr:sulfur oxidation c-type cytochrome SoxX [Salinisphaera sp. W335]MDT0634083.1 sulfur oxidation c-type cytochrome SoxX [Salinisphaera sp. W335]